MTVYFVFSDTISTEFMQNCGVFEKDKVVIHPAVEAITNEPLTDERLAVMVEDSKLESFRLVGCVGDGIRYADPSVKCVSMYGGWATLESYLNQLEMRLA